MQKNKKQIWDGLRSYSFDDLAPAHLSDHIATLFGSTDPHLHAFAAKLCRKRGWSMRYALRVIHEYKKFTLLGVTGSHMVTPPKPIDMVWHEHFAFHGAYRKFCREVLGTTFDHYPDLLPHDGQIAVNDAQYEYTLERYRMEFNTDPPADIWGETKYDKSKVKSGNHAPRKQRDEYQGVSTSSDDLPLWVLFENSSGGAQQTGDVFAPGGGAFGGAGATGNWGGDADGTVGNIDASGNPTDSSASAGSDSASGGDSGSGDSGGGSSCSGGGGGD
jgi:hypothetical protein